MAVQAEGGAVCSVRQGRGRGSEWAVARRGVARKHAHALPPARWQLFTRSCRYARRCLIRRAWRRGVVLLRKTAAAYFAAYACL